MGLFPVINQTITLDTVSWTPLVPPFSCNGVTVLNADNVNAVKLRTDKNDVLTEKTLGPGVQEVIPPSPTQDRMFRFVKGSLQAMFAQATSGTGPLKVTWT